MAITSSRLFLFSPVFPFFLAPSSKLRRHIPLAVNGALLSVNCEGKRWKTVVPVFPFIRSRVKHVLSVFVSSVLGVGFQEAAPAEKREWGGKVSEKAMIAIDVGVNSGER